MIKSQIEVISQVVSVLGVTQIFRAPFILINISSEMTSDYMLSLVISDIVNWYKLNWVKKFNFVGWEIIIKGWQREYGLNFKRVKVIWSENWIFTWGRTEIEKDWR